LPPEVFDRRREVSDSAVSGYADDDDPSDAPEGRAISEQDHPSGKPAPATDGDAGQGADPRAERPAATDESTPSTDARPEDAPTETEPPSAPSAGIPAPADEEPEPPAQADGSDDSWDYLGEYAPEPEPAESEHEPEPAEPEHAEAEPPEPAQAESAEKAAEEPEPAEAEPVGQPERDEPEPADAEFAEGAAGGPEQDEPEPADAESAEAAQAEDAESAESEPEAAQAEDAESAESEPEAAESGPEAAESGPETAESGPETAEPEPTEPAELEAAELEPAQAEDAESAAVEPEPAEAEPAEPEPAEEWAGATEPTYEAAEEFADETEDVEIPPEPPEAYVPEPEPEQPASAPPAAASHRRASAWDVRQRTIPVRSAPDADPVADEGVDEYVEVLDGPLDPVEIATSERCIVLPAGYHDARQSLERFGMVFLHGELRTGRRTAAVTLLRNRFPDRITALPPGTDLGRLRPDRPRQGYLITQPAPTTMATLNALARSLRASQSWLVATVDTETGPPADYRYAVEIGRPSAYRVIERHAARYGGGLSEYAIDTGARTVLSTGSPPEEAVAVAAHLAGRPGRLPHTAVDEHAHHAALSFLGDYPEETEQALLLALAAFDGEEEEEVAAAAERLERLMLRAESRPGASLIGQPRSHRLTALGAVRDGSRVRYERPLQARDILDAVWREHERARRLLLDWLASTPARRDLHLRAARTAGWLVTRTAAPEALEPLTDWATSGIPRQRVMAAEALATVAEHTDLAAEASAMLRRWVRSNEQTRLAAAVAFGGRYGRARLTGSLADLRSLALAADDAEQRAAVADAVWALLAAPASENRYRTYTDRATAGDLLDGLHGWLSDESSVVREIGERCLAALVRAGEPVLGGSARGPSVDPIRLVSDSELAARLAELLATAAERAGGERTVGVALASWASRAARDKELAQRFARLAQAIEWTGEGREVLRLRWILARVRYAYSPGPPKTFSEASGRSVRTSPRTTETAARPEDHRG
jgi:hypothetical protein